MSKTAKIIIGVVVAAVVVAGAAFWYVALRDTADKQASLDAIATGPAGTATGPAKTSADGTWKVQPGADVFGGYRMQELFGGQTIKKTATGRSPAVTGTMTVTGNQITAAEITVDTTKLKSDEARRDSAIMTRGLQTQQFPTATFKLTSPIVLTGAPKQGEEVTVTAKGDLTLHGTTKPVEVQLKAKWNGNTITVAGNTPIVLADYGIDPIEIPGFVKTDDNGTLELQLVFVPA